LYLRTIIVILSKIVADFGVAISEFETCRLLGEMSLSSYSQVELEMIPPV